MTEVGTQWEGQVVNGTYPLRRFLNASDHSAVFLTESTTEGFLNAAIKLVAADPALTAIQLWHWKTAATFSHPHLIRLLDWGQCEIQGQAFLFVVMEYAEENLSQILPVRALGPDEVRELLVPTLDALAFLHSESWVQGQLKPANFLVVNDQLKLATDTIRPVNLAREPVPRPSLYEPPESQRGEISAAADIWALGVTLVESLTQYPPTWLNGPLEPATLPANLPSMFADIVQRCLSVDPADRPTVAELQAQTKPATDGPRPSPAPQIDAPARARVPPPPAPAVEPVMRATPPPDYSPQPPALPTEPSAEPPRRSLVAPAVTAVVVVLVAVWGGNHLLHRKAALKSGSSANSAESGPASGSDLGAASAPTLAQQSAAAAPPERPAESAPRVEPPSGSVAPPPAAPTSRSAAALHHQRSADTSESESTVVHEEIPNVPASARHTIQGHVKVAVRVTVDSSGKVVRDTFEEPGPSKYFSRLASQAARKWKFAAAANESSREWLLRFEFGRDGTTVHATRSRS